MQIFFLSLTILFLGWPVPARQAGAASSSEWHDDMPSALAAAERNRALVLIDFYAPWCYSCYYMAQNVLNQPEFHRLRGKIEPVKVDVDSPEGARLKREWRVSFLPTYVIVDAVKNEVGRIVGEQTRSDFYGQIQKTLQTHSTLSEAESRLSRADAAQALVLAREILEVHEKRGNFEDGLKFFDGLPRKLRSRVERDADGRRELLRLRLDRARKAKDARTCLSLGRELLSENLGCALPYDADHVNRCVEPLPMNDRRPIYRSEEARLKPLLDKNVFGAVEKRCADFRSPVEMAVDLYGLLGRKPEADRALDRAIALVKQELRGGQQKEEYAFTRDRSKTDNLRAFLELGDRLDELDALYPRLIAAYPDDYVYPYRFAKHLLLKRGRAQEALSQLDGAAPKAYGANRLKVVELRAQALAKLGRKDEALREIESALKDDPANFPDQIASLRQVQQELQK